MSKFKHYTLSEIEQIKELSLTHHNYEIAEIMDRTVGGISGMLERFGGKRPPASTIRKARLKKEVEDRYGVPIGWLLQTLHHVLKYPARNGMDKILKISSATVSVWMDDEGIKKRTVSEDNHRRYSTMTSAQIKHQTKAANEHIREYGLPSMIGKVGWSRGLTKDTHSGLKSSSEKHMGELNWMYDKCGEDHHLWAGGKIWWRGKRWDRIKRAVKERDGYTCQHCGISEKDWILECGQPLQVHHIELYRISKNNNMSNLITLCNRCHTTADAILLREYNISRRDNKCIQRKLQ